MSWVAVAAAGGAIVSALISSSGSKKASNTQAEAGKMAVAEQAREFDLARSHLQPFEDTGLQATFKLRDYLGLGAPGSTPSPDELMKQDPGYQFRLDQGNKALTNAASARGMNLSGATLKELMQYGSDYASGEFDKIIARLSGLANIGQSSAAGSATLSGQQGQSTAGIIQGIGNVQAAGQIGASNALASGVSGAGNSFLLASVLKNNQATSGQTGGTSSAIPAPMDPSMNAG